MAFNETEKFSQEPEGEKRTSRTAEDAFYMSGPQGRKP